MNGGFRLRRLAVCASTERELERWLRREEPPDSWASAAGSWGRLVVARRQRFGQGQRGRPWRSPPGGLWLSAAFPWPADPAGCAPAPLAMALALVQEIEQIGRPGSRLAVAIKWPNDLVVNGRKLAGLLPRLRLRAGRVRWAQLGLGLNGVNRVPAGAVALAELLQGASGRGGARCFDPRARPRALEPLAQRAILRSQALAGQPGWVRAEVERRLWQPPQGIVHAGVSWRIQGLTDDGGLRVLGADGCAAVWHRTF